MACRYRPRQACATHRWPPSGGLQCSLLSKDKLSNRLLFYEFTLRSVSQKRLRKILGLSCSTLRQNSVLWKVTRPGCRASQWVLKLPVSPQWMIVNPSPTGTDTSLPFPLLDLWIMCTDAIIDWNIDEKEGRTLQNLFCGNARQVKKCRANDWKIKYRQFSSPDKCLFSVDLEKINLGFEKDIHKWLRLTTNSE